MSALTRGQPAMITGTVGTSPITILAGLVTGSLLRVHNPNLGNGNFLTVTYEGSTPVVFGAGITISPGSDDFYDTFIPNGPVKIVGSAAGTNYTLMWF